MAHAKFSASGSKQWLSCPGSIGMRQLMPRGKQSDAAALGTAAHELLELCLNEGLDANEMIDRKITVEDQGQKQDFFVDDNMADAVQVCIDLVRSYQLKYPHAELKLEQKVDISELTGEEMFGTVDIRLAVPFDKLIIIDYKHGQGVPVEIEDNTQLIYYALGAAKEDDFEFDDIEMVIVQPRCPHKDGPIRSASMTMEDLRGWVPVFQKGVRQSKKAEKEILKHGKPLEKYTSAGEHCKFCPAAAICPSRFNQVLEEAEMDFDDFGSGEKEIAPKYAVVDLPNERLIAVLKYGNMIKEYVDAVFSHAQNLAERGVEIPEHKLVKKRAYAKFTDENEIVIEKLVTQGFSRDMIVRENLETLTKLRKICGKDVIDALTHIPDTGVTLVHESDKRPAVEPSVFEDFED